MAERHLRLYSAALCWERNGFDFRQIEFARGLVDVESDNLTFCIEIDIEAARAGSARSIPCKHHSRPA